MKQTKLELAIELVKGSFVAAEAGDGDKSEKLYDEAKEIVGEDLADEYYAALLERERDKLSGETPLTSEL